MLAMAYESSSDEEDVATEGIIQSVLKGYAGDSRDLKRMHQFLEDALKSPKCLICLGRIKRVESIWSCVTCYCFCHQECIQRWGYDKIRQRQDWDCPQCRQPYVLAKIPTRYVCFCGKKNDPPFNPSLTPHSCGEMCQRPLKKPDCGHKCLLLCHPGPCPPCPQTISRSCECGKSAKRTIRCPKTTWECQERCHLGIHAGTISRLRGLNISNRRGDYCTHFISIPFKDEQLQMSFNTFRDDLLQNHDKYRVNRNIIQKTPKLHRTIINLSLADQGNVDLAKRVLKEEKEALKKLLEEDTQEKHVIVKGIIDPTNLMFTDKLYVKVISAVISRITYHLTSAFRRAQINMCDGDSCPKAGRILIVSKGLLTNETRENINYSFNPMRILREYRDHEFGSLNISEIHISRRHRYDANGYYEAEMVLEM